MAVGAASIFCHLIDFEGFFTIGSVKASKMVNQMPSNSPYLIRSRHGIYYFRLVIPPSQRSSIGKIEFRRSLRTRSKREAVMRCAEALTEAMGILAGQGSEKAPVTPLQAPKPVISSVLEAYKRQQALEGVSV
ncbi:MAG: DUF6538 domain-containing protein, partial [Pseudomonadota bacterium]